MSDKRRTSSSKKNTFILKKLENENKLQDEIKMSFDDPTKYLSVNPNMIIGRVIRGPRLDDEMRLIPHSIIGNTALFEEAQNLRRNSSNKYSPGRAVSNNFINPMNTTATSKKEIKKNYFDYIDDTRVRSIFKDYTEIKENNKEKLNDFMKKLPSELKNELKKQELNLKLKNYEENHFQKLSEYLAKKLNKSQDELLINRIDEHRLRKEFGDFMDQKVLNENKSGRNNWVISLRKSKNTQFVKNSYLNLGSKYNPMWANVRDQVNKSVDIIRKPNSKSTFDLKGLANNKLLLESLTQDSSMHMLTNLLSNSNNISINGLNNSGNELENSNNLMNSHVFNTHTHSNSNRHLNNSSFMNCNLPPINEIQIAGKDLLKTEMDIANSIHGRKILYKKNYFDIQAHGGAADNEKNQQNLHSPTVFSSHFDLKAIYSKKRLEPIKMKVTQ